MISLAQVLDIRAKQLGMRRWPKESLPQFKERVFAASKKDMAKMRKFLAAVIARGNTPAAPNV